MYSLFWDSNLRFSIESFSWPLTFKCRPWIWKCLKYSLANHRYYHFLHIMWVIIPILRFQFESLLESSSATFELETLALTLEVFNLLVHSLNTVLLHTLENVFLGLRVYSEIFSSTVHLRPWSFKLGPCPGKHVKPTSSPNILIAVVLILLWKVFFILRLDLASS